VATDTSPKTIPQAAEKSVASSLPYIGHSTNLVGIPTPLLGATIFNDHPKALRINGVREMNRQFFGVMLGESEDLADAGEAFRIYMEAMFGLEPEQQEKRVARDGVRRFRSSYLRLLKGWGYDNNSREGAVMKGWVESRFGLFPTFHKEAILKFSSAAWANYIEEKMSSRFHNNSIYTQLDVMYEFCQYCLDRFINPGGMLRRHARADRPLEDQAAVADPVPAQIVARDLQSRARRRSVGRKDRTARDR
jgi:NAD+--dinitrogen-reductase ADP-D-ribosyltransferase